MLMIDRIRKDNKGYVDCAVPMRALGLAQIADPNARVLFPSHRIAPTHCDATSFKSASGGCNRLS